MSDHRRLVERSVGYSGRVDRENGVVRDVQLLGAKSRNGRRYTADAMQVGVSKYEGVKVYLDHPTPDQLGNDRSIRHWVGVVRNARFAGGAIRGDLHLRKQGRAYEEIMEAAEHFPESFGMSHVADGDSRIIAGEEVVESITSVFSVDLVMEPATAAGLFESQHSPLTLAEDVDRFMDIAAETGFELPQAFVQGLNELVTMIGVAHSAKQQREEGHFDVLPADRPSQTESARYFGPDRPPTPEEIRRAFANNLRY